MQIASVATAVPPHKVSQDDIAERAGTSSPTILYYFESKDRLLEEAVELVRGTDPAPRATGTSPRPASSRIRSELTVAVSTSSALDQLASEGSL
jgi:AcrR family transcriptional regulator